MTATSKTFVRRGFRLLAGAILALMLATPAFLPHLAVADQAPDPGSAAYDQWYRDVYGYDSGYYDDYDPGFVVTDTAENPQSDTLVVIDEEDDEEPVEDSAPAENKADQGEEESQGDGRDLRPVLLAVVAVAGVCVACALAVVLYKLANLPSRE